MIQLATEQWLDTKEVTETLLISRSTLFNVRRAHGGPGGCLRLGRKLYWNQRALLAWLHACEGSSDVDAPTRAAAPAPAAAEPPVAAEAVHTRPRGVPVTRPAPAPDYSRPPGEDIWQGLGEPITTRFQ